jgi:hypothetical protein
VVYYASITVQRTHNQVLVIEIGGTRSQSDSSSDHSEVFALIQSLLQVRKAHVCHPNTMNFDFVPGYIRCMMLAYEFACMDDFTGVVIRPHATDTLHLPFLSTFVKIQD